MQDQDKAPTTRQQERQVVHLVAKDLVIGRGASEAAVKAAVKAAIEAERAKPRTKAPTDLRKGAQSVICQSLRQADAARARGSAFHGGSHQGPLPVVQP